jgi:hypothetical protein
MSEQTVPAASDATEQTEPEITATEQPKTEDYAATLLKLAQQDGLVIGLDPPKEDAKPEAEEKEPEPESEPDAEGVPEGEDVEEEVPKVAAKKDDWPDSAKQRVAEETAKRKRANERAEKAEAIAAQLQQQVQQIVAPRPVEDDPFRDINDINELDRLEGSYEKAVDLADDNPEGAVDVVIGRDRDGKEIKRDFAPDELLAMRKKADKAIRKFIPERRTYLQQRAAADEQAVQLYPELQDPQSEVAQVAGQIAYAILNGYAPKDPSLLIWIGRAVKGYQLEQQANGKSPNVKTPEAKRIVESARQKIAPAPVRSRPSPERRTSSADLDKATNELKEKGSTDAGEKYVAALFSQRGSSSRKALEPLAE